ncbi:dihydrodipicolinate synthase family protein [Acuticoccus sp. I52.16.1]|uniref:dihydrodipicolinate synthase family protein n=1 Tax=Acuticoccus sp. I52.16.1 TaxID=2928472 RepID=UPI001FD22F35|nr:dihydrodipicolinate synthase family protein [Acuticoccus sp. I52.16.1]UOM34638.1 dihydrodipicolinate synthase family protein [Acuticoccus sp. I52.16.1]
MAHRLTEDARGVYIISATPFTDDGAIDHTSIDKLTDFYLESGVDGITILGIMGEAPKLTGPESIAVLTQVLERVDGRVPVIVGVSNPGLDNMYALAETAMDKGAAGVMVAPNAAAKTESNVINLFEVIGKKLDGVPIVYQDFPLTTSMPISAGGFAALVEAVPNVVMLKHEDWPGLPKLTAVRQTSQQRGTRRVSILCGNGGLYLPQELARGADGAMTGFAYPEMLVEVVKRFHAGDQDGAEDVFDTYLPLVRHEQQPGFGLAVRKEILRRRGIIASAATRAPGPKLDATGHAELTRMMERLARRLDGGMAAAAQ